MCMYDMGRLAAVSGSIPARPPSGGDPYRQAQPPSRSGTPYTYGVPARPSCASLSSSPVAVTYRSPSPARSTPVGYGAPPHGRLPSPLLSSTPKGSVSLASVSRGGGVYGGKSMADSQTLQGFYPTPSGTAMISRSSSSSPYSSDSVTPASSNSAFLAIASQLQAIPPDITLALSQVGNSLETLATDFPVSGHIVQQNRPFAEAFLSWVKLLLPVFSSITSALLQLRSAIETIWRAAGGFIAASTARSVTVDIEIPDPKGGAGSVMGRERLAPFLPGATAQMGAQLWQIAAKFAEVGEGAEQVLQRLSSEAERFMMLLMSLEQMKLQVAPSFPGGPVPRVGSQQLVKTLVQAVSELVAHKQHLYHLLSCLSSGSSVSSGNFFLPSEARSVFQLYRCLDRTLISNLTQISHAYDFTLKILLSGGYLPPGYKMTSASLEVEMSGERRVNTFPSLQPEKVLPPAYDRLTSSSGIRSSSPPQFLPDYRWTGVRSLSFGGGMGTRARSRSRTR